MGHLAETHALFTVVDLPAHPDVLRVRHVDDEPPGERNLGRDTGPLGPDRLLGHLDEELLAAFDDVLNRWVLAVAPVAVSAAVAVFVVVLVHLRHV